MDEEYTVEKTIAFFAIGNEHYVTKDLARYIATTLERMTAVVDAARDAIEAEAFVCDGRGYGDAVENAIEHLDKQ